MDWPYAFCRKQILLCPTHTKEFHESSPKLEIYIDSVLALLKKGN